MKQTFPVKTSPRVQNTTRTLYWVKRVTLVAACLIFTGSMVVAYVVIQGRSIVSQHEASYMVASHEIGDALSSTTPDTFPIGVNPHTKLIAEDPALAEFVDEHVLPTDGSLSVLHTNFFTRVLGKLALHSWYQNIAMLSSRVLVIEPGERKEQVADNFAKILNWNAEEKDDFLERIKNEAPTLEEGKLFPGTYTTSRDATPSDVAPLVLEKFNNAVLARYTPRIEAQVPLNDTLVIASLLEREARDFDDMRHISGVIWNRLFAGMRLQIDATLQYAKGTKSRSAWWPRVLPADKYVVSAYNTYKHDGLPPTPIANPSLEAIIAALNPVSTDCMFYFHDSKGGFHCTVTYEEHVALLKQYYGRGK